ncbi:choline transporter-like protein 5-B isoform X3 [Nerophis lumbriciformis]|uniref:choline transporter-like protein 5-B isoform X3 n=1 Tax=Nerophis lumbriciformis TaxID=546530 RepID=UPI002ADFC1AB|nr:choline transporter-like protein 5 isoform X3 [Nerophis lumbriciformis]
MARKTDIPPIYYGEPQKFDPNFRGPIHNRSCTDVICCVIFIIFIIGYIALGTVAWIYGDPRRVTYPTDSQGQFCGQQGTPNANKAILLYYNMLKCANPAVLINLQCPTTQLCVSKCPDRFATLLTAYNIPADWNYYKQFCKPGFSSKTSLEILKHDDCPSMIVPSRPFMQRCFPDFNSLNGKLTVANKTTFNDGSGDQSVTNLKTAVNGISNLMNAQDYGLRIFEDYANSWYWILISLVISMLVSLFFILLLRFIAGVCVWIIIVGAIVAIGYGIGHCYWEYSRLSKTPDASITISDIGLQTDFNVYLQLSQTWLIFMILLAVIEGIILIVLIFLRQRLQIAIELLKEGSRAVGYVMTALLYPIFTFFLIFVCIAYFAVTAIMLASSGIPVYKVTSTDDKCIHNNVICIPQTFSTTKIPTECPGSQCSFAFYGDERYIFLFHLCNLFAFLWLVNFTIALGQCTLAGAFASYYWALKKPEDIPACPLFSSFSRAIRYHTGSLAFGAFILSVVQMIRIVLEYLDHKLKRSQNAYARYVLCCLKCCFWCLERFIKFINKNAYIMIAIYGKNFCTSSKNAFFLLMRNIIRVAVLDKVTEFLLFLGKLLIAGSVGILAFYFFTHKLAAVEDGPKLNYFWIPMVTVIIGAFLVAHGFFNVYSMCVDTLFLCFCEDLERNDGSSSRPYFMSPGLRRILHKGDSGGISSS